ncbi:MAG: hypothetical protein V2A79_12335 [Planctomycetota bacterium]
MIGVSLSTLLCGCSAGGGGGGGGTMAITGQTFDYDFGDAGVLAIRWQAGPGQSVSSMIYSAGDQYNLVCNNIRLTQTQTVVKF